MYSIIDILPHIREYNFRYIYPRGVFDRVVTCFFVQAGIGNSINFAAKKMNCNMQIVCNIIQVAIYGYFSNIRFFWISRK